MRIHSRIEYTWDGQRYVEVYEEGFCLENGQVALCKGASDEQNDLAKSQTDMYNTLSQDYKTQFGDQSAILSSLNNSLSPIVNAGPNQFGYSVGQTNALNSTAIQGTAQNYQNAQKALQNQQAAQGGGNMALPSGVNAQNAATLSAAGANQESSELLGIQNAGFAQGNQNYNNAVSQMGGVAAQYSPTSYAGSATSAGNSAANEDNTIQQENAAASPWGAVGGLLGGLGGAFLNPIGTSLGKQASSVFGGGSGSNYSSGQATASQSGYGG